MTQFISASAAGKDWRDVIQKLLKQIDQKQHALGAEANLGFLYVSDKLVQDIDSILELLRSITSVPYWVGTSGIAVMGGNNSFKDQPAASCMLASFDVKDFSLFDVRTENRAHDLSLMCEKYNDQLSVLGLMYHNGHRDIKLDQALAFMQDQTSGFFTGGVVSSRQRGIAFTQNQNGAALVGCCFSNDVDVVATMFEGAVDISQKLKIERCREQTIDQLENMHASRALLNALSTRYNGNSLETILPSMERDGVQLYLNFHRYRQNAHIKRSAVLTSVRIDGGTISSNHTPQEGDYLSFALYDAATMKKDMAQKLMILRERLKASGKLEAIKGGIYVSSLTRLDEGDLNIEQTLIKEILGDIPLAGFYSSGEISHHHLYSFTGVLTLFL